MSHSTLSTQQIGRLGELLVQYQLLTFGVDSAPMTTDAGIDLVAYSSSSVGPKTIQVKANLRPKPGGGKGKAALDWWVPVNTPAQLIAFVDISTTRVWLFTKEEVASYAQQRSSGRYHFYMYTDEKVKVRKLEAMLASEYRPMLLERRVSSFFFPSNDA